MRQELTAGTRPLCCRWILGSWFGSIFLTIQVLFKMNEQEIITRLMGKWVRCDVTLTWAPSNRFAEFFILGNQPIFKRLKIFTESAGIHAVLSRKGSHCFRPRSRRSHSQHGSVYDPKKWIDKNPWNVKTLHPILLLKKPYPNLAPASLLR